METRLNEYEGKRNFAKTQEPIGRRKNSEKELIFVVQHHLASRDHYDFRLEWDGALLSWAVPKGPSKNPRDKRLAVRVEDHPYDYKDFEGTIPQGEYGGGTVMLWDEGTYRPLTDMAAGLERGSIKIELHGTRLKGAWTLVRLKSEESGDNWLLIKEKDSQARSTNGLKPQTSVRSGRTMEEIEKAATRKKSRLPFHEVSVELPKLLTDIPTENTWLYEIKYDGYRIVSYVEPRKVKMVTRNGIDYTKKMDSLARALSEMANGRSFVLDGEVVAFDSRGQSDFSLLQRSLKKGGEEKLRYAVFDLLALDGEDLRPLPLTERKEKLKELLNSASPSLIYSDHIKGKGRRLYQKAARLGLEGIVGKKPDSPYTGTRSGNWIKVKCRNREEFVIVGYTTSDSGDLRSLLLGLYKDDKLIYTGKVGTGFTEKSAAELLNKLGKIRADKPSYEGRPIRNSVSVKPKYLAEVEFAEWTGEGVLRQPSYKGLRLDKSARETKAENSSRQLPLTFTHPDKIIDRSTGMTKMDAVEYYRDVSSRMLPFLDKRILASLRCHEDLECFFKKHPQGRPKYIRISSFRNDSENTYFYVVDEAGILEEVQLGTLEFHLWGSKAGKVESPDYMVFDLDPDPKIELDRVRDGARDLKKILQKLGLKSFLKTSGGKGYHVVVPISGCRSWEKFRDFARSIAQYMEETWPERYTSNVRKKSRRGRIFIDWLRNGRGATSVAPYSLRARPGLKISMPIAWSELDKVKPDEIDMAAARRRLKRVDPWTDFFSLEQRLPL